MNTFTQTFDNLLDAIQSVLMSILTKIGPFFVALMPALFTAYAIFHTFKNDAGPGLALFFAIVVGLAMETVGIVATHTAIDLYNAADDKVIQPVKFWLMVGLVPVYVLGVAGVVYFSEDAFTPLVKGLGVASPFLTCIVYIAVALARDIRKAEAHQQVVESKQSEIESEQRRLEQERETKEREWQQEKERLILEQKHEERLSKIAVKNTAKSVNESVQNSVKHGDFDTVNLQREERKKQVLDNLVDIFFDNPKAPISQVAGQLNISRQTIYNYLDELEQAGKIHRNGAGVEVLK